MTTPRGLAFVDGEQMSGVESFSVDNNGYFQADTFRLNLILSAQPDTRTWDWWSRQTDIQVELLAGYPSNPDSFSRSDLKSLITGYADDIQFDPLANTITIVGRDLTSKLIDAKRSISFQDHRSSDIVVKIAEEVGLTPDVVATESNAGTIYEIMSKLVNSNMTYWDIVTKLAQFDGYSAWVSGKTLHYRPRDSAGGSTFVLEYHPATMDRAVVMSNAEHLSFSRNLSVARDIKVTVYSSHGKNIVKAEANRKKIENKVTRGVGHIALPPQEYVYRIPGLTADKAQERANTILQNLSQHEMVVQAAIPADMALDARSPVKVIGTGTAFDQTYYPASIITSYSMEEGLLMSMTAKNTAPDAEITQ